MASADGIRYVTPKGLYILVAIQNTLAAVAGLLFTILFLINISAFMAWWLQGPYEILSTY